MSVLYPFIFGFGEIKRNLVTKSEQSNYINLVRYIKEDKNISWGVPTDSIFSIPIYKQITQQSPDFIVTIFLNWCEKVYQIVENNKIKNNEVIILIDLRTIDRDQQVYHISNALLNLFENEPKNIIRVILILEKRPASNDALYKNIQTLVQDGKISVADRTTFFKFGKSREKDFQFLLLNNYYDYYITKETLKGKLIRRVGHFNSSSSDNVCKRYFYDGRYCDKEIRKLSLSYIIKNINLKKFEFIFYISKESPWLKTSISALSGDIEADLFSYFPNYKGAFNVESINKKIISSYTGGHILLISDLINTTKSIKEATLLLLNDFNIPPKNLHLFSILNNSTRGKNPKNQRSCILNNQHYNIDYLVDVELLEYSKATCPMCLAGIDFSEKTNENFLQLQSYDFWDLADLYSYEDEKSKPDLTDRKRLFVPKFTSWIEENAPYLTYKFYRFIEEKQIKTRLNFAIIFPDESKGKDGKRKKIQHTASGLFASKLSEIFDIPTIGIPRFIIDKVTKKEYKLDDIINLNEQWKYDIQNIPPNTDLIILDEFHKGGSTFLSLKEILEILGNPPKGYFTIADFNPSKSISYENYDFNCKLTSLYEFDYL